MLRTTGLAMALLTLTVPLLAGCTSAPGTALGPSSATSAVSSSAVPSATGASTPPAAATPTASPTSVSRSTVDPTSGVDPCVNSATIPAGARRIGVADVDGDGHGDVAFLTASAPYEFGFATSSGGVFTTPDPLPARGAHHAWTTNTDGFPGHAVVLDDGLFAAVLRFQDCRFAPVRTPTGGALRIPIGARSASGDATTGVACNDRNGGVLIEAAQARLRSNGRYDIAWATLEPAGAGNGGTLSAFEVRFADVAPTSVRVAQARTSRCWASPTLTVRH